MHAIEQVFKD